MSKGKRFILLLHLVCLVLALGGIDAGAALRYESVVSDAGQSGNNINYSNISRRVAVGPDGAIYVVYSSANGIKVAKSTDEGATFSPSVSVAADASYAPEVAVSSSGTIYVAWVTGSTLYLSRSTDAATTFSAPAPVGLAYTAVHMATNGEYVYLVDSHGSHFYRSSDAGLTFTPNTIDPGRAYADVVVDPGTGEVLVQMDDPTIRYFVSSDHGVTFAPAVQPTGNVYHSTAALSSGSKGRFLFIAGTAFSGNSLRVDLQDGSSTVLQAMPTTSTYSNSRSLAADRFGNVVTGITNSAISFSASNDLGDSFFLIGEASGIYSSIAINPVNGDIICVYEQGEVILAQIHKDLLVGYTSTSLASSGSPTVFGEPVTFTATVGTLLGTPTGTVTFKARYKDEPASVLGTAPVAPAGTAALTVSSLPVGAFAVTAEYSGAADFGASASPAVSHEVQQAASSLALMHSTTPSVYGDPITLTATVAALAPGAGTPTGTVQFLSDGSPLGAPCAVTGGSATLSVSLDAGSHLISAEYLGDDNFTASSDSYSHLVLARETATSVSASANPAALGEPLTLTATVAVPGGVVPTGEVQFKLDGNDLGSAAVLSDGVASLTTTTVPAGSHVLSAVYLGNGNLAGSSSTGYSVVVQPACAPVTALRTTSFGIFTTVSFAASSTPGVTYRIQYSNDGSNWTTAYTGTNTRLLLIGKGQLIRVGAFKTGYLDSKSVSSAK